MVALIAYGLWKASTFLTVWNSKNALSKKYFVKQSCSMILSIDEKIDLVDYVLKNESKNPCNFHTVECAQQIYVIIVAFLFNKLCYL